MSQTNQALSHDDSAVLKHMDMYQGIITRMAGNSAACKRFCITIVMAFLAYVVKDEAYALAPLVLATIAVFYMLDSFYLKLENEFREGFNHSANLIQKSRFTQEQLFQMKPMDKYNEYWNKALTSPSTLPVYLALVLVLVATLVVSYFFL